MYAIQGFIGKWGARDATYGGGLSQPNPAEQREVKKV
jgi:hypothetical protein